MTSEAAGGCESSSSSWSCACSDDELVACGDPEWDFARGAREDWRPPPRELDALYAALEAGAAPALAWRCAGRREPATPPSGAAAADRASPAPSAAASSSNFDFTDEMGSLELRVRREGEDTLRGSAKKKTTSFDGIISNVMRHKRIQQLERERADAATTTTASATTTTSS